MAAGVLERPDEHAVRASFHVMRFRDDEVHQYVRRYRYRLRSTDNGPQIAYRRAVLTGRAYAGVPGRPARRQHRMRVSRRWDGVPRRWGTGRWWP